MNGHTTHALSVAEWHPGGEIGADPVCGGLAIAPASPGASRTDAERLRDAATLARMAAAALAHVTAVTARTDGAATLQALRQAAGDLEGFAQTREAA